MVVDMDLDSLTKEQLHSYLRENKAAIIAAKKQDIKFTESISVKPVIAVREVSTKEGVTKADNTSEEIPTVSDSNSIDVTVVCNTAWFCDSQMDVLTDTSYTNSVNAKGTSIPHIADHKQSSTAHVGDVTAVYTKEFSLKELGLDQEGSTTALVMETTIRKDYNEDVYKFYSNGKINQHSIGLRYVDLKLAINSKYEDDKEEYAVWSEYYPKIVNKELVDKRGYFYAVKEVNIIENSCVLFGANSLTPTLSIKQDSEVLPTDNIVKHKEVIKMSDVTAEKLVALQSEVESLKAAQALAIATAVKTERTRCETILTSATTFGVKSDTVVKAISKGWDLEVVSDYFSDVAEKNAESTAITTAAVDVGSAGQTIVAELIAAKAAEASAQSFNERIAAGFKELDQEEQLFKGVA